MAARTAAATIVDRFARRLAAGATPSKKTPTATLTAETSIIPSFTPIVGMITKPARKEPAIAPRQFTA